MNHAPTNMFTGIVQKIGTVTSAKQEAGVLELQIRFKKPWPNLLHKGESIAVDGVCLTVIRSTRTSFAVQAVPETLDSTTLGNGIAGKYVNLERSLRLQDFVGGHFVFGHVDTTGKILKRVKRGDDYLIQITTPSEIRPYLVPKGSIAVDGISLTVQRIYQGSFEVAVIPHTAGCTTIALKKKGERVNIEVDMMAKQVYQLLKQSKFRSKH